MKFIKKFEYKGQKFIVGYMEDKKFYAGINEENFDDEGRVKICLNNYQMYINSFDNTPSGVIGRIKAQIDFNEFRTSKLKKIHKTEENSSFGDEVEILFMWAEYCKKN